MAKRTRNIAGEQTYMKHPFQHESLNPTGYKQLKYEDSATVAADETGHGQEYRQRNVSSPTLGTVSATVPNSPVNSPTNPFSVSYTKMNGFNSYNGLNPYHLSGGNISQGPNVAPTMGTGGGSGGGHYVANISAASLTPNMSGKPKQILLDRSRTSGHLQASPAELANESQFVQLLSTPRPSPSSVSGIVPCSSCNGIRYMLFSLALMCVLSLFTAFLAMFFLQKSNVLSIFNEDTPLSNSSSRYQQRLMASTFNQRLVSNAKEYQRVFQISICLSTLTIALDLCCLFVCCIQFLSIVKLIKTPFGKRRSFEFIKKTSSVRVLAIGSFLVSIPIFFTGVILFTFVNFEEIPALITSIFIGCAIIFCGIASVQNVYLWQWEKTKASEDMRLSVAASATFPNGQQQQLIYGHPATSGYPAAELSTLV